MTDNNTSSERFSEWIKRTGYVLNYREEPLYLKNAQDYSTDDLLELYLLSSRSDQKVEVLGSGQHQDEASSVATLRSSEATPIEDAIMFPLEGICGKCSNYERKLTKDCLCEGCFRAGVRPIAIASIPDSIKRLTRLRDTVDCIKFADWCAEHYERIFFGAERIYKWRHIYADINDDIYTTDQLYSLFTAGVNPISLLNQGTGSSEAGTERSNDAQSELPSSATENGTGKSNI